MARRNNDILDEETVDIQQPGDTYDSCDMRELKQYMDAVEQCRQELSSMFDKTAAELERLAAIEAKLSREIQCTVNVDDGQIEAAYRKIGQIGGLIIQENAKIYHSEIKKIKRSERDNGVYLTMGQQIYWTVVVAIAVLCGTYGMSLQAQMTGSNVFPIVVVAMLAVAIVVGIVGIVRHGKNQ